MEPDPEAVKARVYPPQETRVIIPASVDSIHTKNLLLRPLELADAADLYEFRSRQDVADWLLPNTPHKSVQETEEMITKKTFKTPDASGALGRRFNFAIIRADDPSQKVIGSVGVNALVPAPSLWYGIHPDFWGKGYMSEAVAGVVGAWWELERKEPKGSGSSLMPERLFAACDVANVGSAKVLERNGFKKLGNIPLNGDTVALFGLEKP